MSGRIRPCAELRALVERHLDAVDPELMLARIAELGTLDRYQASAGLGEAAELVARWATAAGVDEVSIDRHDADGSARWWDWRTPTAWTPVEAVLRIEPGESRSGVVVDHAVEPFSIATYSAPTPEGGRRVRLVDGDSDDLDGALVVVPRRSWSRPGLIGDLERRRASGFVTDGPCVHVDGAQYAGRIELAPDSKLFGFSVTTSALEHIHEAAEAGDPADVVVSVDRSADMPVVTGLLAGADPTREVWLTAHLCHPRPGANDNASGVVAVLAVAEAHARMRREGTSPTCSLRFIWGPEFLGTASVIFDRIHCLPEAVINLDMVGEDQQRTHAPFVVELPPDAPASMLGPLAEAVVEEAFALTSDEPGVWLAMPFTGFSDHALFADPAVARPAVALCHVGDRVNHTAGDVLEMVSPVELTRATASASALAQLTAHDTALAMTDTRALVEAWSERRTIEARRVAAAHLQSAGGSWSRGLVASVDRTVAAMGALVGSDPLDGSTAVEPEADRRPAAGSPVLSRCWQGPLNVREMLAALPPSQRRQLLDLVAADKLTYSRLFNIGIRIDGSRTVDDVVQTASWATGWPIGPELADQLIGAFTVSGWAVA